MFNLFNLSNNNFRYPFTKQHFFLYKQVTNQYHDPAVLKYVNMLIPENIKKEIKIQLETDISKCTNHISDNSINHFIDDIDDRNDDNSSSSSSSSSNNCSSSPDVNGNDSSSSSSSSLSLSSSATISLSASFLNSIRELMIWFKKDFMRWVDKNPSCDNCGRHLALEYIPGNTWEVRGIENHYCSFCNAVFSFPRYGKIKEIADFRMGRCSEWTFLFGAMLNSVSIKTRIVHDFLDHCWNESLIDGRWIHMDSTLAYPISFDHPSYYEKNWNKEYLFVIAFSNSNLEDVTSSYTINWNQVLKRRSNLKQNQFDLFQKYYQKI